MHICIHMYTCVTKRLCLEGQTPSTASEAPNGRKVITMFVLLLFYVLVVSELLSYLFCLNHSKIVPRRVCTFLFGSSQRGV